MTSVFLCPCVCQEALQHGILATENGLRDPQMLCAETDDGSLVENLKPGSVSSTTACLLYSRNLWPLELWGTAALGDGSTPWSSALHETLGTWQFLSPVNIQTANCHGLLWRLKLIGIKYFQSVHWWIDLVNLWIHPKGVGGATDDAREPEQCRFISCCT